MASADSLRQLIASLVMATAVLLAAGNAQACTFSAKFGGESSGAGHLERPRDVAIDAGGNAWVADTNHHRVQEFSSSGEFVSQFGVEGEPLGIAVDAEGNVWIVETIRIRKYKANGELLLSFGSEGEGNGQFKSAQDIAIDPSGNLWVVDKGKGATDVRVQKFNAKGEYLSQFGKEGTENGQFKTPEAIAVDSEGNVLVADTGNNRYQEFNSASEFVRKVGSEGTENGQFKSPRGIAVDSEGKVWVADSGNNRVQHFNAKGGYL